MERWDLRDGEGIPTGETMERGEHLKPGQYHLVVHIWVIDGQGRLLIQKRAAHLKLMPDVWAATGGSAVAGEDSHTAAARELREELGIETAGEDLRFAGRIRQAQFLYRYLGASPGRGAVHPPASGGGGGGRQVGYPLRADGHGGPPDLPPLRPAVF